MMHVMKKAVREGLRRFGVEFVVYRKDVSDRVKEITIGKYPMKINGTHALPHYLQYYPDYSSNFPRLVCKAKQHIPDLIVLDVGANIGDTVAMVRTVTDCPIVCIEGDAKYYELLRQNISQFDAVWTFRTFLGEQDGIVQSTVMNADGTSKLTGSSNQEISIVTLDTFLKTHEQFQRAKILKIDTDGYDTKIIKGAMNYIKAIKPVMFMEYDRKLLADNGENGLDTLQSLIECGYDKVVFYDNYGRYLLSASLKDKALLRQLEEYMGGNSPIPYYDICLFSSQDTALAESFIDEEMSLLRVKNAHIL